MVARRVQMARHLLRLEIENLHLRRATAEKVRGASTISCCICASTAHGVSMIPSTQPIAAGVFAPGSAPVVMRLQDVCTAVDALGIDTCY